MRSILEVPEALDALQLVRPVLEKLGIVIVTRPPAFCDGSAKATRPPGNVICDIEKAGLFLWRFRQYSVRGRLGVTRLAFDMMHEVAHLVAAEGDTAIQRASYINYQDESCSTLQIEVRLWGALGRRWESFVAVAERFGYCLDDFPEYAFESLETHDLVKRGLLTPNRETIRWDNARKHIHAVRA